MPAEPTVACPPFCARTHTEGPGEVVLHETEPVHIAQAGDPDLRRPVLLQVSRAHDDPTLRLHVSGYEFDMDGAEMLLAELTGKVMLMRAASDGSGQDGDPVRSHTGRHRAE